jgi:hypothetical protein
VEEKIGVFVADNADVNDWAVCHILGQLRSDLKDPDTRRGCCFGHIINLAARDFIFGKDVAAFEEVVRGVDESTALESEMRKAQEAWRKKGPVGKLHNIVVAIRQTPQRREKWKSYLTGDDKIDSKFIYLRDHCVP